jgi:hypothetical protein
MVTVTASTAFGTKADSGQRDTTITLTFIAPREFETAGGEAHLLSTPNQDEEKIEGTFETSNDSATATFEVRRGWEDKSFPFIALAGQQFALNVPVEVAKIKPRTLKVEPDLLASTEKAQAFRVTSNEALEDGVSVCSGGVSVKQGTLQITTNQVAIDKDRLDVPFTVQRPDTEMTGATLVLEICNKSARWMYTGDLGTLRPVRTHRLKIEVKHGGDGAARVILRPDITATGSAGEAEVLEGPKRLRGLSPGTTVPFRKEGDVYVAEVPVDCTAGELVIEKLTLLARNDQSDVRLFHHSGEVAVCPSPGFWDRIKTAFIWILISGVCLALLGLVGYLIYGFVRKRLFDKGNSHQDSDIDSSRDAGKATPSTSQIDLENLKRLLSSTLLQELAPLETGITELKRGLAELRERIPDPLDSPGVHSRAEEREEHRDWASASEGVTGSGLTDLVNRWWKEGADRTRAEFLLQSRSVKPYRSLDINESLRNLANRTFTFQATDGPIEWLGQQQQEELLIVPCDPRLFETGDSLKFLGLLFEGVSLERSFTKVRFRCVRKPCRLQRDSGFKDLYRLVQRGQIEMEGQAKAASTALGVRSMVLTHVPQASSPVPDGMAETRLARIVKDAVIEAVPRDLTVRVEELFRQVGSRLENEPRRAEPGQLDPNLIVSLEAMRKGIAACDGELRAHASVIREVKGLIETLRGDFLRIGSELRHSDSAVPVSQESFFSQPMEVFEVDAAIDLLGERPARPLLQESSFDTVAPPWRSVEPVHVLPEEVLDKLDKWWPVNLPAAESSPDTDQLPESSTYLWRLEETQKVLARVSRQRGWEVSLVHLGVPDGSAQGDASLLITGPVAVSRDFRSASFRGSSFADALLFQFALSIHGDAGRHIALLPAAGLRVDKHHHAYSRLIPGRLPESAMRLTKVIRPAVLIPAGQGGLYTVASPLKAEFR